MIGLTRSVRPTTRCLTPQMHFRRRLPGALAAIAYLFGLRSHRTFPPRAFWRSAVPPGAT